MFQGRFSCGASEADGGGRTTGEWPCTDEGYAPEGDGIQRKHGEEPPLAAAGTASAPVTVSDDQDFIFIYGGGYVFLLNLWLSHQLKRLKRAKYCCSFVSLAIAICQKCFTISVKAKMHKIYRQPMGAHNASIPRYRSQLPIFYSTFCLWHLFSVPAAS